MYRIDCSGSRVSASWPCLCCGAILELLSVGYARLGERIYIYSATAASWGQLVSSHRCRRHIPADISRLPSSLSL